jgi:SpoVK/Ycf46/Vps4 family AAA+-type ATPase
MWYRDWLNGSTASPRKLFEEFKEDNDRLAMCPPRVLGYILKDKLWAQFKLKSCIESRNQDSGSRHFFRDQLQLAKNFKDMLLACVNNHDSVRTTASSERAQNGASKTLDVIEGKGKGLAILLHGPPGVGKTLTAETIALATDRPLLTVSVAEIGSEAAQAEGNLRKIFAIAARWGAILLIDEADVFLEERVHTDNPNRNMLVSVLLRSLEYYEGIIFLTTNRIRSIDIAVQSRMHFTIQYKRLDQPQKFMIYQNLLNKVDDKNIHGSRSKLYNSIDKVLCRHNQLNGRQIRNIVSMGLALAKSREDDPDEDGDSRLTFEDLQTIHETTVDSLQSLQDVAKQASARNEAQEA